MVCHVQKEKEKYLKKNISESNLTANIYFYNFYKANDVSPELLLKEYENFCKNKGQWDNLELYMDFMYARDAGLEGSKIDKYTIPIREYKNQLHKYLNVKGYDFDKITKNTKILLWYYADMLVWIML
mgnify:CR=1 FL=1